MGGKHATMKKNKYARACKGERVMKRILRMAGAVMVCMALGFATVGTDIQTVYAQEEVRGAGTQTADGWSYETNSNGTLTITGYSGTETKVTVPATIGGKSVSEIGYAAFASNSVLEEMTVSEGIQTVNGDVFTMSSLKKLWLPASLNTFRPSANMDKLEGIYVDSASQFYKDVDGVLYNKNMTTLVKYPAQKKATTFAVPGSVTALADSSMDSNIFLQKIVLPDSVELVDFGAFKNCSKLSDVTLPEQCKSVGQFAFSGTALTSFYIPAALDTLGAGAFMNTKISSMTVSPQNTKFYLDGKGGLYEHSNSTHLSADFSQWHRVCEELFYYYGSDEEYTILDGTITLEMYSFCNSNNLKKLVMPDSVQTLESSWLSDCSNLEELYLSPSLSILNADSYVNVSCQKVYGYETTENHAVADKLFSNGTSGTFVSLGTPYTVTYYGPGANSSFKTYTMGTLRRPVWKEPGDNCGYRYYYTDGTGSRKEITSWPITISQNMEITVENGSQNPDSGNNGGTDSGNNGGTDSGNTGGNTGNDSNNGGNSGDTGTALTGKQHFASLLYENALGRTASQSELDYWAQELTNGRTGAEVAYGFLFSEEFQNKNYSDADYVEHLYLSLMGRASDEGGKADWVTRLGNGVSRLYVFQQFTDSVEFGNLCNTYEIQRGTVTLTESRDQNYNVTRFVARNYTEFLGRTYDVDGLNDWSGRINSGYGMENVAYGFVFSQECINMNLSNSDYVKMLYRGIFGRSYDDAGLNDWVNQLNNGTSRETVFWGFANSQEFANMVASYGL